jgi:hypothetical protein
MGKSRVPEASLPAVRIPVLTCFFSTSYRRNRGVVTVASDAVVAGATVNIVYR